MSRIVLHIDRLVLRGIEPDDASGFAEALQVELQRQLATHGSQALQRHDGLARLRPAPMRIAPHSSSEQLGQVVATHLLPATERGAP